MKKILLILSLIMISTTVYAEECRKQIIVKND